MISLLKHADRVKIGCLAQLVNVIAPIMTAPGGAAWRQTTFHPFALTSASGRGTVLHTAPRGPLYETKWLGEIPVVDLVAVQHDDDTVSLFAVNRSETEPIALDLDVRAIPGDVVAEHVAVFDEDPDAVDSVDAPDRVTPKQLDAVAADAGTASVLLPRCPGTWSRCARRRRRPIWGWKVPPAGLSSPKSQRASEVPVRLP